MTATGVRKRPKPTPVHLKPIDDPKLLRAIIDAISDYDLTSSSEWSELDQLSSRTQLESIDANPDGIFEGPGNSFEAVGDVYVTLSYGDRRDSTSVSDSYPVQFAGSFDRKTHRVTIKSVKVDTASFYQ